MDYPEFLNTTLKLYTQGEWQAALEIVEKYGQSFPDEAATIYILHTCLLNVSGNMPRALQVFQEGLDQGYWWPTPGLRQDPDLASLQGNPDFERMVAICEERHAQAQSAARPELLVFPPTPGTLPPYPLMLILHWRGGNAKNFAEDWKSLSEQGWLVAAPQSSQMAGFNAYCWDDMDKAIAEIQAHAATLTQQYHLDQQRILLGGFSQGAGLAIWLSASGALPTAGFISIGPYLMEPEPWLAKLPTGPIHGRRGYIISGELEQDGGGTFPLFETALKDHSIPYHWHTYPGLGHQIPSDFKQRLEIALNFIFSKS